jgi:hypothetical protein
MARPGVQRDAMRTSAAGGERESGMATREGVSEGMAKFIAGLSPDDRDSLLGVLRDSRTYLAEDMTDVIAILRTLES